MKLTVGANHTMCSQVMAIFQNDGLEESLNCSSLNDDKAPNEVLYIIGLLLAPIFACLTIAMFLLMVFIGAHVSEYVSKLLIRFGQMVKPEEQKTMERKRSIVLVRDTGEELPNKPPRFANSRT